MCVRSDHPHSARPCHAEENAQESRAISDFYQVAPTLKGRRLFMCGERYSSCGNCLEQSSPTLSSMDAQAVPVGSAYHSMAKKCATLPASTNKCQTAWL